MMRDNAMKTLIKALCVAAIAGPLGLPTMPAYAQSGPNFETPRDRSDFPQALKNRGPSIWLRGRNIQRDRWPVYRNPVPVRPRHHRGRDHWARDAHEEWCYGTYRSYRAWDNTFQPHNGPRRRCNSPYG
jgi:hypothetical protein